MELLLQFWVSRAPFSKTIYVLKLHQTPRRLNTLWLRKACALSAPVTFRTTDVMKAMPGAYYIYVEDVDGTFRKSLASGAEKIFEPTDMPYSDREV